MVPLTLLPQLLMGTMSPRMHFGPDTSIGILPQPHLVAYYAIFFGFGMSVFISGQKADSLGRWWPWHLLGACLCFPAALATMANPVLTAVPQILFAWLMCFGFIGMFRRWCSAESRVMRYVSDSSYWLYLMHIPLVIVIACLMQTWKLPIVSKAQHYLYGYNIDSAYDLPTVCSIYMDWTHASWAERQERSFSWTSWTNTRHVILSLFLLRFVR